MKTAIVIVHYGKFSTTKRCIESIFSSGNTASQIIIVNNNPELYSPRDFTRKKIIVINNKKNVGFAVGVNKGISYALSHGADIICMLNNDTICRKPFLRKLCELLTEKQIGIAGCAIAFYKNKKKMLDIGGHVQKLFLRTSHQEVHKVPDKSVRFVDYISGCCMAVKKDVFKKIGFFDKEFFLYYEDVDFCLRARREGFYTVVDPSVSIYHELSTTIGKMSQGAIYYLLVSGIHFGKKYATTPMQRALHKIFILLQAVLFLRANSKAAVNIARALLQG